MVVGLDECMNADIKGGVGIILLGCSLTPFCQVEGEQSKVTNLAVEELIFGLARVFFFLNCTQSRGDTFLRISSLAARPVAIDRLSPTADCTHPTVGQLFI